MGTSCLSVSISSFGSGSARKRWALLIPAGLVGASIQVRPAVAGAADVPSAPSLSLDYDVFTKESIVEINGKKFRKVEYKTNTVYLQLLGDDSNSSSDVQVMCEENGGSKAPAPQQVVVAVKITKRTSLFVDGLRKVCQDAGKGKRVTIDPALQVGFMIHDDDPKAILKNKKVFISPLRGGSLNFSGEW